MDKNAPYEYPGCHTKLSKRVAFLILDFGGMQSIVSLSLTPKQQTPLGQENFTTALRLSATFTSAFEIGSGVESSSCLTVTEKDEKAKWWVSFNISNINILFNFINIIALTEDNVLFTIKSYDLKILQMLITS